MQKSIPFIFLFFIAQLAYAQNETAEVSGRVLNTPSNRPIEFASVLLTNKADSTLKFVTTTDSIGEFLFENISAGSWQLKCSFIGFNIKDTTFTITANQKKVNMGKIVLSSTTTNLKEVVISAEQQKAVEFAIDKKIYNVSQDIHASSGSASDVLKNIPSVQVDIDGNISLRGSGNILFLVNGKPAPQFGKNTAEALQNFPASSIERIEVITNPSAKYKPDGTAGIINIVLTENAKQGLNGSVTLNAGNNDRYNGNISLSYKPGKLNLYGIFGLRQNTHIRHRTINRTNLDSLEQTTSIYKEGNNTPGKSFSQSVVFGMDYELDSNNTMSLSCNYFHFKVDRENTSSRKFFDTNNLLSQDYKRISQLKPEETEIESAISWEHKFKKEDHALSFECAGVIQDEHENSRYSTIYLFPLSPTSYDNVFLDKKDNPLEVSLDYSNPVTEDATLEAGYAGTFNNIVMDYRGEFYDTLSDAFLKDNSTSYNFLYKDMRNAVYMTWEQGIEDFSFLVGLRAEQANLKGNVTNIDSTFKNDYFSLYPTTHLKYELDNAELGLSYSRRVNRPDGDELNPFPEYDDPRNLQAGNPKLLPEYIHSIELGCEMKGKKISFMPTLYYRYTYNGFTTVTNVINDSTLLTTQENLSNSENAGLELIFFKKISSWFSGNLSSNIFYNKIDASNLGYSSNKSAFFTSVNISTNITLANRTTFQMNYNYHSEELTPQGKHLPAHFMNIGVKQELWKNKLAVVVTLNDVFKSQKHEIEFNTHDFRQTTLTYRNSRIFYVGIKYRFGSLVKKSKEEAVQFDNNEK